MFVALIYKKQCKIANVFIFILEFYKINIKNTIKFIFKSIQNLNKEINFIINREIIFVCRLIVGSGFGSKYWNRLETRFDFYYFGIESIRPDSILGSNIWNRIESPRNRI